MNTKHSPGPWSVFDGQRGNQKLIVNEATTIAQTMCGNDRANAQLIAAAPMLLDALKRLTELAIGPAGGVTQADKREAIANAVDAIAAATGETE